MSQTVVVIFQVDEEYPSRAEQVVAERLERDLVLGQNDSSDIARGTADPIRTFGVVPARALFEEWI